MLYVLIPAAICIISGIIAFFVAEYDRALAIIVTMFVVGIFGAFISVIIGLSNHETDFGNLCTAQGGIVSQEQLCIKNNHPIPFQGNEYSE